MKDSETKKSNVEGEVEDRDHVEIYGRGSALCLAQEHIPIAVRGQAGHHATTNDSHLWWNVAWPKLSPKRPAHRKNPELRAPKLVRPQRLVPIWL